jgi:hypothetical protein
MTPAGLIRSAKALVVPDTLRATASNGRASFSIWLRSVPITLIPTGVRPHGTGFANAMMYHYGVIAIFNTPSRWFAKSSYAASIWSSLKR